MKNFINTAILIRWSAIISSISLIVMTFAAFFSYGYAHSQIFAINDAMLTYSNLQNDYALFNAEILGWFIIILTDIIVSFGFYIFFYKVNPQRSALAALFRLSYTFFLISGVLNLLKASQLLKGTPMSSDLSMANLVYAYFANFEMLWSYGLILFGFHLFLIGLLSYQIKWVPKTICHLLIVAGTSYILIHILHGFLPQLESFTNILEMILSLPMMIGELSFGGWLLLKGGK